MTSLRRYLALFAPHRVAILLATALLIVGAALPALATGLLGATLGRVLDQRDPALLFADAFGFAALLALQAVLDLLRARLTRGVAFTVASGLRQRLFARLLTDRPGDTGARVAMLLGEVDELPYGVSALVTALRNPLQLLGLAAVAAAFAPKLALLAPVLLPAVLLPSALAGRGVRRLAADARAARAGTADAAHQALIGAEVLQAFDGVAAEAARFARVEARDREARLRLEVLRVGPGALGQTLAGLAIAVLVWRGGTSVLAGELGAGDLVGFAVALGLMNRPLLGLSEVWTLLHRALASSDHVLDALEAPPPLAVRDTTSAQALAAGPIALSYTGVAFAWPAPGVGEAGTPATPPAPVLRGVDLTVSPGEIVALRGATGAGKTTLAALASRLVDPTAGAVRLGGVDVRDAALAEVRGAVSVVDQGCVLFARSVRDNLTLGRSVADEVLWSALRDAGADDFVRALRDARGGTGLDATLGELGRTLSGGERQRLGLARAWVAAGRVLVLDEATNQVDVVTRDVLIASVQARRAGRAVLWITHDPAVIAAADRVVTLTDGVIA